MQKCGIAKVYEKMSEEDCKALRSLLAAPVRVVPAAAVSRELWAAGHDISYQIVTRHRAGTCSCESL